MDDGYSHMSIPELRFLADMHRADAARLRSHWKKSPTADFCERRASELEAVIAARSSPQAGRE